MRAAINTLAICTVVCGYLCNSPSPAFAQDKAPAVRNFGAGGVMAPAGYRVEAFAAKLDFPVDVAFGDDGQVFVAEAGAHSFGIGAKNAPGPQIVQLMPSGEKRILYDEMVPLKKIKEHDSSNEMPEGLIPPITGLTWHEGKLYVSHRSRYSVLDPDTGDFKTIVNGLPCWGEFVNAKPIFNRDGKMVFFVSTQGNSGVVERHWMAVINTFGKKKAHEIPGEDVQLTGKNFAVPVEDPETPNVDDKKMTGPYLPLGKTADPGATIKGQKICNGAFYRCDPDGSNIERIAWGFRSSFGYRFSPDGRLFCTQNSANPMPPRGLFYDWETIYEVQPDKWYGWPDYFSGVPITDERFAVNKGKGAFVLTKDTHQRLLQGERLPPQPVLRMTPHAASQGMVFGKREFGLHEEHVLVAQMGTVAMQFKGKERYPAGEQMGGESVEMDHDLPGKLPVDVSTNWPGFKVQLIDLQTGQVRDFLKNRRPGPATADSGSGLERPLQLAWGPDDALYVVDFGVISLTMQGMKSYPRTGVIWRISRQSPDTSSDALPLR